MPQSRPLGIDLGTSCVAVARVDDVGRSAMVRSAQGEVLFDSIVFFEDDDLVFSRAAKQAASIQPQRAAEYVKRDLGQKAYSRAIGGELLPAELIEACLLKECCAEVTTASDPRPAVVLSIPSSFDQSQRKAVLEAAEIASLDTLGTISDPLASALAFAESQGYLDPAGADKPGCRALVFDLGGGKLDVAIVEIKPGRVRTMALAGDARLGGRDWDTRLADHLAAQFAKQFDDDPRHDMVSVRRLLESAAEAKHTLTARQQARVRVERQRQMADITITRQAFEEVTADLVTRARQITEQVLSQAAMAWRDVTHLLLVGGATRMPMISQMLESLTGLQGLPGLHPDEAVARGAALLAEKLLAARERRPAKMAIEIVDLASHTLGLEWLDPQTRRTENVVLLRRGTELPCSTLSKLTTTQEDQRTIAVHLLEGESRSAEGCARVAEMVISELPPGLPALTSLDVHYQITTQNRLQIKAQLAGGNRPVKFELFRQNGLSESQVGNWRKLLAGPVGLKAVLAHQASKLNEAPPPRVVQPMIANHEADEEAEDEHESAASNVFDDAEFDDAAASARLKRRRSSGRKMGIMALGHVVFAVLGLLVGYYILMRIDPGYNWWHLRLPGLAREAPAPTDAASPPQ